MVFPSDTMDEYTMEVTTAGGSIKTLVQLTNMTIDDAMDEIKYLQAVFASSVPGSYMMGIFGIASLLTNGIVLILFLRYKRLRTPANRLVISLTMADILFALLSLICLFLYQLDLNGFRKKSGVGCVILRFCNSCCGMASSWGIVAISTERYVAVCKPLRYHSIVTSSRATIVICTSWFMSLSVSVSMFLPWPDSLMLAPLCGTKTFGFSVVYLSLFITMTGIIPASIICVFYTLIYKEIRNMYARRKQGNISVVLVSKRKKSSWAKVRVSKSAKLFSFIALMFFIVWSPLFVAHIMIGVCESCSKGMFLRNLLIYGFTAFCLTKFTNPLIYTLRNADFAEAFRAFFKLTKEKNERKESYVFYIGTEQAAGGDIKEPTP